MKGNFEACFQLVLEEEGGYVNDPRDPGGRTNLGVTQRAWEAWAQKGVNEDFMRKLTPDAVRPFYEQQYWQRLKADQLAKGLDYALMDMAVNSGVSRAVRYLQQLAGTVPDGVLGPKALEAIAAAPPGELVDGLCDMRMEFLRRLTTFPTYGKGWTSRVTRVKARAEKMIGPAGTAPSV